MTGIVNINGRIIGDDYPPYIVAELSANHNGDLHNAIKLIEVAKDCGADAVKLQTYTPDTMTIDCDNDEFMINEGLWSGRTLYELYKEAFTPWEWHQELFNKANELGITIFSTPFDSTSVDFLEKLNVPAYKIASFEINDVNLIKKVALTGKPVILSTGMANYNEINTAVTVLKNNNCFDICLLHCVSGYPTHYDEINLQTIKDMKKSFDVVVGLSDHTLEKIVPISAVAAGASVIEKHLTLSRSNAGPDNSFSIEPHELKEMVKNIKKTWRVMGKVNYNLKDSEKENIKFRRSLYVVKDIKKGDKFTESNIASIRPGFGLLPEYYSLAIGRKSKRDMLRGTPLNLNDIDK
jgi:pseudaminic acid synthase